MAYGYDAMSRLTLVTDNRLPAGQNTTTYSCDAAGNLVTETYPNQTQQTLMYDTLNRVTQSAAAVRSDVYNRAASGHVLSVAETSGRSATYNYDSAFRLTNETVAGDPSGKNGALGYSLDAVTNRQSLSSTLSGLPA